MHFEVEKNVFIKALGKVSKATGSSSVVTRSIYFEVENGIAKIVGFDNTKHISIITTIAVTGDNGKFLVDASMLQGMLSKMNGDKVSIEVADNGSSAIIKCGKTKTTLTLADVSLFPITAIELVNTEPVISVPYDILKALIGVSFASGTSDMANAIMTAVDFKWKDGKFIVSALDGHRVARRYVAMNGKEFNVHVAAQHLKAIFAAMDTKSAITIKVSGNAIEFNDGTTTASTAIVDGNFFDIDKFQSGLVEDTTVSVSKKEMAEMLARMSVFSSSEVKKPVRLEITSSGIHASLATCMGTNEEDVDATITGNPVSIGVNVHFISDVINELTEDTVTLRFGANGKSPIVIKRDDAKAGYFYMILPCVG